MNPGLLAWRERIPQLSAASDVYMSFVAYLDPKGKRGVDMM